MGANAPLLATAEGQDHNEIYEDDGACSAILPNEGQGSKRSRSGQVWKTRLTVAASTKNRRSASRRGRLTCPYSSGRSLALLPGHVL